MKQFTKFLSLKTNTIQLIAVICIVLGLVSCSPDTKTEYVEEDELFSLDYGNFENEINLFDINSAENINTRLVMRDGFFYIVNGEAGKIMQLTSYGDLIGIIYDENRNPVPTFVNENDTTVSSALDSTEGNATKRAVSYPFNNLGAIAIDNNKNIYVTDFLPVDRYEEDTETGSVLRQVILRFNSDGTFVDFLAQEGLGGQPFPYIKSLHTTNNNDLIAICLDTNGHIVYWFSQSGELLTRFVIEKSMLPEEQLNYALETYITVESIVPDYEEPVIYIKADYYGLTVDESTKVSSGIEFEKTLVYPLDVRTLQFEKPITIPAYEQTTSHGYATEVFLHPYSFLGVSETGGLFFMIPDTTGLSVLVTHEDSQKIVRRQIQIPLHDSLFQNFSLSNNGIVSALIAHEDNVSVSWWRTDSILNTITE